VVVFLADLSEDFSEDFVDFRCFLSGLESSDLCLLDFFRCLDLVSFLEDDLRSLSRLDLLLFFLFFLSLSESETELSLLSDLESESELLSELPDPEVRDRDRDRLFLLLLFLLLLCFWRFLSSLSFEEDDLLFFLESDLSRLRLSLSFFLRDLESDRSRPLRLLESASFSLS